MGKLHEFGITVGKKTKSDDIFDSLFPDSRDLAYDRPSDYVKMYWQAYLNNPIRNNNLNGKIFEYILATLCIREGLIPLYMGAKVAFVPNVEYDLMFYTAERGPVCFSAKTSLRERYKQADLEAIALKYVHRKALCYLITLDEKEAKSVKTKIEKGDIIGLDNAVIATTPEFDDLIRGLKKYEFSELPTIRVVESSRIITRETVSAIY